MTKPKYASAAERNAALAEKARKQMRDQWQRQRAESGAALGYFGQHRRVRTERGPAKYQTCECGKPARHWAWIHDTDPEDPQNYKAMCISCHRRYDQTRQQQIVTLGPEGRTAAAKLAWSRRTPEQRREIMRKAWDARRRNAGPPDVVVSAVPRPGS